MRNILFIRSVPHAHRQNLNSQIRWKLVPDSVLSVPKTGLRIPQRYNVVFKNEDDLYIFYIIGQIPSCELDIKSNRMLPLTKASTVSKYSHLM